MRELHNLFRLAQDGDQDAMNELVDRCIPVIQAYVRVMGGRVARARESRSDVVQSACCQVFRNLDQCRWHGEGPFRAWVCRVTLNVIRRKVAFNRRELRDVEREVAADDDVEAIAKVYESITPSRHAQGRERLNLVERALEQLTPEQQQVIVLSRFCGMNGPEIAIEMDRSHDSVRALLHRAMSRLVGVMRRQDMD